MFGKTKPDEMELEIRSKSMLASHRFTEILLAVWTLFCVFTKRSYALPLYILAAQAVVRTVALMIYKRQVGDERWKRILILATAAVGCIIFLALLAAAMLVKSVDPS